MATVLFAAASLSAPPPFVKHEVVVPGWPKLPYPFSTAILSCLTGSSTNYCTLHISGMQGYNYSATPPGRVAGGILNETTMALYDIAQVAKAAGSSMDAITECEVWLSDINDFDQMNEAYSKYFTGPGKVAPTRIAAQAAMLGGGAKVEIKCNGVAPPPATTAQPAVESH